MAQKQTFVQELLTKRDQYQKALIGINAILEIEGIKDQPDIQEEETTSRLDKYGLDSIRSFNDGTINKAVVPQKVLYALKKIGEGTAHEVAETLSQIIAGYPTERALKDARNFLSKYYKSGIIEAEQIGNKNLYRIPGYSIPEEDVSESSSESNDYSVDESLPF